MTDGARESAREERKNSTERKDQAQGEEQEGRKIEEENDQEEARTPAICHGDLTYPRRILSSAYSRERNPSGRQTRTK